MAFQDNIQRNCEISSDNKIKNRETEVPLFNKFLSIKVYLQGL